MLKKIFIIPFLIILSSFAMEETQHLQKDNNNSFHYDIKQEDDNNNAKEDKQPEHEYCSIHFLKQLNPIFRLPNNLEEFARSKIEEGNKILQLCTSNDANIQSILPFSVKDIWESSYTVNHDENFFKKQRIYLDAILAIAWAIFDKAVAKDQGFTGGTIVIVDEHYKIFNFLLNYVRFVNPTIKKGCNPSHIITNNVHGYSRLSTHFIELQRLANFDGHYGIDIRNSNGNLEPLLPTNKQHILFGKLNHSKKPLIFIKFETYGLSAKKSEMIKHLGKAIVKNKKDITETHIKMYSRREDIPKEIKISFEQLLGKLTKKINKEIKEMVDNEFGYLCAMYKAATLLSAYDAYENIAKDFLSLLEKNYDYLDIRKGNEVIIKI